MTAPATLAVEDVSVRYGGNVALDTVSLTVPEGRVTGLIGPNGAGKTTMLNACSGTLRASGGRVLLFGTDMTTRPPAVRARHGLGRTFQRMELYDSLTVAENVRMGREAARLDRNPWHHLVSTRQQRQEIDEAAAEVLDLCGLVPLADRRAGALSTGQRRLVEFARALAGPYRILLLDEQASGLDRHETARFGEIVRAAVDRRGVGVLLVEHDVELVMEICSHIYVLDFGELIFEGTPPDTLASPAVRSAYLGSEEGLETAEHQAGVI